MTVTMRGGIPQEEPYYPTLIEKVLHFFGKHILPYEWLAGELTTSKKGWEGYSKKKVDVKQCLYPGCGCYKIKP